MSARWLLSTCRIYHGPFEQGTGRFSRAECSKARCSQLGWALCYHIGTPGLHGRASVK